MAGSCSDCKCPVNPGASNVQCCRKGRVNLGARGSGAQPFQCCRCADVSGKEYCLFCIEQQRNDA
eukprot:2160643-Rhodomonas_salina.1